MVQFMLYCAYRARLEAPFLMAELASAWASESAPRLPPASPPTPDKPPTTSEEDTKSNSLSVGSPVKMDKGMCCSPPQILYVLFQGSIH